MVRTFITILISVITITSGFCQINVQLPNSDAGIFLAGEHYPVIYKSTASVQELIMGAAYPCTTSWHQVGFSSIANDADNRNIGIFNPEIFTVGLKLACNGSGDSANVSKAYFECAYDTTTEVFWNADSSNYFIEDGCYSHDQYGLWRFEALDDTTRQWLYPLRMMIGGYIRLILASNIEDTCQVRWTLICEH